MATFLRTEDGKHYLNVDHILRVEAGGDIVFVHMDDVSAHDYNCRAGCHYKVALKDWLAYLEESQK
jgi:hypothetical protein